MSNEKVLAALFERMEITFMAYNGPFLGCAVKKRHPLALNFTGKMVSWTINSTLILKLAL